MSTLTPEVSATSPGDQPPDSRPSAVRSWAAGRGSVAILTGLAVFSALVVGSVLMIVTTSSTIHAWSLFFSNPLGALKASWDLIYQAYGSLVAGAFESRYAISETLVSAAPLMVAGLAVALGFKAGLFNIGAQGQLLGGVIATDAVAIGLKGLPVELLLPLALLAGLVGGGLVGAIPGLLKARTGAHEVIVTIMFNYVMLNLVVYLLSISYFKQPGQSNAIGAVTPVNARLPHLAGHSVRLNAGIIVALLAALGIGWLVSRTTLGFRFRMIGSNPDAARSAGVNIARATVLAMLISGALAGIAGSIQILGIDPQMNTSYGGSIGFDAITVALLGRSSTLGVVLASLLYGALEAGGLAMQAATSVPIELIEVIQAVIVLFIAAPALVRDIYRVKQTGGGFRAFVGGWGA